MWRRKIHTGDKPREEHLIPVTDEELDSLAPEDAWALFALNEAMGVGDYELSRMPKNASGLGFVKSYHACTPPWSQEFLAKVQAAIPSVNSEDLINLDVDLSASMEVQAVQTQHTFEELHEHLAGLLLRAQGMMIY